jgi:hypothetical protein
MNCATLSELATWLGPLATWVGALLTLLAVLVALFKEVFLNWLYHPLLIPRIDLRPPDCHKTRFNGGLPAYYLRIWIENRGTQRAHQVQVFVSQLLRKHADGRFHEDLDFLPMNLRWAHTREVFADGISPGMGKHCDLGFIPHPAQARDARFATNFAPKKLADSGTTWLSLDLEALPNTESHILESGTYRLELRVAAANAKPHIEMLEVALTSNWFDDQAQMFSKGIGLVSNPRA